MEFGVGVANGTGPGLNGSATERLAASNSSAPPRPWDRRSDEPARPKVATREPSPANRPSGPARRGVLTRYRSSVGSRMTTAGIILAVMWLLFVGVATAGLLSAKAKANTGADTFTTLHVEEDAYVGWLTEDGQTDSYAALASLHGTQPAVLTSTWQQAVTGRNAAEKDLATLSESPNAGLRARAATARHDLVVYNRFNQEVRTAVVAGTPTWLCRSPRLPTRPAQVAYKLISTP